MNGHLVLVPEWLSGMTRNHVGFARAGSNPAEHGQYPSSYFYHFSVNIIIAGFREPRRLQKKNTATSSSFFLPSKSVFQIADKEENSRRSFCQGGNPSLSLSLSLSLSYNHK